MFARSSSCWSNFASANDAASSSFRFILLSSSVSWVARRREAASAAASAFAFLLASCSASPFLFFLTLTCCIIFSFTLIGGRTVLARSCTFPALPLNLFPHMWQKQKGSTAIAPHPPHDRGGEGSLLSSFLASFVPTPLLPASGFLSSFPSTTSKSESSDILRSSWTTCAGNLSSSPCPPPSYLPSFFFSASFQFPSIFVPHS
mmetsp:Transcript_21577/g.45023  ORF Transcript_21577/g.45023 Transcript_21577/m.45023 type:complete len:203 (+) Transcript_21577:973-1581(+)